MCGRFFVEYDEDQEIFLAIKKIMGKQHPDFELKSGDVFPSQIFPVITGKNEVLPLKWGIPFRKKAIINARSESLSLLFSDCRRCLIPASGFYEWSKNKERHFYTNEKGILYMAGLFKNEESFVILTREAIRPIAEIHDRMPVLVQSDECKAWLGGENARYFFQKTPEILIDQMR